ncbi:hypothetical protein BB560_003779, partial [Smittium megazygosporum]
QLALKKKAVALVLSVTAELCPQSLSCTNYPNEHVAIGLGFYLDTQHSQTVLRQAVQPSALILKLLFEILGSYLKMVNPCNKIQLILYLEAIRNIFHSRKKLSRNVYVVFTPDEEMCGIDGVKDFFETQDFRNLNVAFDLEEDISGVNNNQVIFMTHGNTGHGIRKINKKKLHKIESNESNLRSGEITSINLTDSNDGKQAIVVPATYSVTFDIGVSPNEDVD